MPSLTTQQLEQILDETENASSLVSDITDQVLNSWWQQNSDPDNARSSTDVPLSRSHYEALVQNGLEQIVEGR